MNSEVIEYIEARLMEVLEKTDAEKNQTVVYSTDQLTMAKRVIGNYQASMSLIRDYINDAMDSLESQKIKATRTAVAPAPPEEA